MIKIIIIIIIIIITISTLQVLGTIVTSDRQTKYVLSQDLSVVQLAVAEETHNMVVEMRQDAGGSVQAKQIITFIGLYLLPT